MTTNQALAMDIAECLLEALPIRFGTIQERRFITKAALIIAEKLDGSINQKSPQDEGLMATTNESSSEYSG
ncbi:MAG: hypothetical protein JNJ77_02095 [Planctomycetia bacterium]|nr:hypothetical protein [Planctomycetia bacterium]